VAAARLPVTGPNAIVGTFAHRNLLGPLGVTSPPATVEQAVAEYRVARDRLERRWEMSVPSRLGDEVAFALVRHGVM
jgi:hypothetical protein